MIKTSKEIAKTEITAMIVQLFVFAIMGAIAIIGILRDNTEVWQTALYALGFTGAGYVVKTVGSNSKVFKAVQSWFTEHTPNILEIVGTKRSGEIINNDGVAERAIANNSSSIGDIKAQLEEISIKLEKDRF